MEIKHQEIIDSILNKEVKDRKEWEHQFLIKYKHQDSVRRYFLSMGEFKDIEIKDEKSNVVIFDDNELSIMKYAQEYPENWQRICESLDEEVKERIDKKLEFPEPNGGVQDEGDEQ